MPRSPGGWRRSATEGGQVDSIALAIKQALAEAGLKVEVSGREKHPYSIWKKMAERHVSFEQITDIMAFRVLTETADDCYRALGILHTTWQMIPGRFKDYISTPKSNGYRSLHTALIIRKLDAHGSADPHPRDAPHQRVRPRRALGLQAGRDRPDGRSAGCAT